MPIQLVGKYEKEPTLALILFEKFGALLPEWSPILISEEQKAENPGFFVGSPE